MFKVMVVLIGFCIGSNVVAEQSNEIQMTVKPEDTYKYYPKEVVVHYGGKSPVIVYK